MRIKLIKISNSALFIVGLFIMKTTLIITSILFLAVIVASVFYFRDLNRDQLSREKPFSHIPQDASLLVSFRNDETTESIFSDYQLFRALLGDSLFHKLQHIRQTVLRRDGIAPFTDGQEIIFSIHPGESGTGLLMVLPTGAALPAGTLFEQVAAADTSLEVTWTAEKQARFQIRFSESGQPLFVGQKKGIILASFTEDLLIRALDETQPKLNDKAIAQFRSEELKNTPLALYVNHNQLFPLADTFMQHEPGEFMQLISGMAGESVLKMNFNGNALMFSGTSRLDTTANYLSLYRNQEPVAQDLKQLLPTDVATGMLFGISDFPRLHQGIEDLLADRNELPQMQEQHRLIREQSAVSIQHDLLPEWGDEFAVVELANRETLGVIEVKDSLAFSEVIQRISTPYPENTYRLNHSNLLYYSFGDPLKPFTRPYFMLVGNYFIFANHTGTLRRFKADYDQRKMLVTTPDYIAFDRLQANRANVSVFIHQENAANTISRQLKKPFRTVYTDDDNFGYGQFYAWSVQLSGASGSFFSSFYAAYIDAGAPGATPDWSVDLHGRLITPPAVFHYDDTSQFILAQASNHILYALSSNGRQLWNAQLPGPVLGEIHQLSDSSLVLTTAERLYRFDTHGDPLPGFSLALPHRASYSATVYEKEGDVRLFVPAGDRILAYNATGESLPHWEDKPLTGNILYGMEQATLQDVHYVIAATDAGRIYFFNYNGQLVHLAEDRDEQGFGNPIALQTSPTNAEESRVITTDTSGTIKSFFFGRDQRPKNVGNWSARHYFDAVNITGDSIPELVFADRGELAVYDNATGKLVYHYDFGQEILRPLFFYNTSGKYAIGVATSGNQLLYVFREDGTLTPGFPTEGLPPFYYGKLETGGPTYLLVGKADRKLYAYRF